MDSGLYTSCSGLVARMRALEVAAQDLANVNTNAYRGQRLSFQTLLGETYPVQAIASRAINQQGVVGPTSLDASPGQMQRTGEPFDLAIEGSAFFVVQGSNGPEYTRNGNFHASPDGYLVTDTGGRVLGDNNSPVRVIGGAMSVSGDGTISVNGAVSGKLRLVQFDDASQLTHAGGANFIAPLTAARPAQNSRVRQGMLEGSNVNGISAAVGLIALQRHAEMLQRAMSVFHSEFNRSAVEDLPRI